MIDIIKPTLLINKEKSIRNIEKIGNNLKDSKVDFRPHFKTHQSLEIGRWFKKYGINKIIMDKSSSSSGIVPYLPIDKLQGKGTK